ncbi:MAG: hypothetical protein IPM98_18370 [Lewinellaceae bacterium]|nr:hypothetical protein [Lewinellaceae bacterium]
MTKRIASLTLLTLFAFSALAQTTGKTFTKSFNTDGMANIKFDLPGAVDLKIWNHSTIRFEISVDLPSGNVSMLDQLSKVGRYDLKATVQNDALIITAPNLNRVVRVKGEELKEIVSYTVFVPKDLGVELLNSAAVAEAQKK